MNRTFNFTLNHVRRSDFVLRGIKEIMGLTNLKILLQLNFREPLKLLMIENLKMISGETKVSKCLKFATDSYDYLTSDISGPHCSEKSRTKVMGKATKNVATKRDSNFGSSVGL